jgi:predicted dienelactone hydrolase
MSLSDEERQRLDKLGQQLENDDPRLARSLSARGVLVFGHVVGAATLLALAGALLLFIGIAGNALVLAMLGLICLAAGAIRGCADFVSRHRRG